MAQPSPAGLPGAVCVRGSLFCTLLLLLLLVVVTHLIIGAVVGVCEEARVWWLTGAVPRCSGVAGCQLLNSQGGWHCHSLCGIYS